MYQEFRTKLISLADEKYRDFSMKSIPCVRPFIGVRIPEIRKLIKEIPPEHFPEFLNESPTTIEEVLARGFLIARLPYDKMLNYFDSQVELLDNWCTVDTFVTALRKTVKNHEEDFLEEKVSSLLKSKNEFTLRTGLVCLLDFYVEPGYLQLIFDYANLLGNHQEYYVKMALAWLLAECFIKYPDEWTYRKAISKICDSYRVDKAAKKELRKKMLK